MTVRYEDGAAVDARAASARRRAWSRPGLARPGGFVVDGRRSGQARGRVPQGAVHADADAGCRARKPTREPARRYRLPVRCGAFFAASASSSAMRFWRLASFSSAALVFFSLAFEKVVESEKSSPWPLGGLARRAVAPQNFVFLKIGLGEVGVGEVGALQVGAGEVGADRAGEAQVRVLQARALEVGADQERARQVGVESPAAREVGALQVGLAEAAEGEVGAREVHALGLRPRRGRRPKTTRRRSCRASGSPAGGWPSRGRRPGSWPSRTAPSAGPPRSAWPRRS